MYQVPLQVPLFFCSSVFYYCDNIPGTINLKEKVSILPQSFRDFSHWLGGLLLWACNEEVHHGDSRYPRKLLTSWQPRSEEREEKISFP